MTPKMESGGVLTAATEQWANRPSDERFASLADLHTALTRTRAMSVEARDVNLRTLHVESIPFIKNGAPVLVGKDSTKPASFTHHAFGQFCRRVGAPPAYLRTLPAPLAAENLNYGLATLDPDVGVDDTLLFVNNGSLNLRATLTARYTRIWGADISSRLIRLTEQSPEWQPAPAAFDGSRGLYASDQDMFCFLVDNNRRIFEKGPAGGLSRGFFVENSEVGSGSFAVTTFFYEYICGNHRVWGTSGVSELRIPHIGRADERAFDRLNVELTKYADASAQDDELKIASARKFSLGGTKDEVLDSIFGLHLAGLGRKVLAEAYSRADEHNEWYGDPKTVWGLTGGITEIARDLPNASDRTDLDRAAGKIMQMAF